MYNAFYELQREPFHVTPDPDFLFPSPAHKEALAAIIYGIEQRKGFVAITGEVGVGKTTILRSYLDFADRQNLKLVYIYNSNLTFDELVTTLLQELGVASRPPSTFQAVTALHEALIDVYRKNQTVVLIVDEAQNMPIDTLESLRMLSNLETVTEKLIQIMLIGQPEFDELLQQHRLRQLRQRIAIHARIGPLNMEDSIAYLEHRLAKVSLGTKPVFTKNALRMIAEASEGIPRNLNILSDNALITGYGYQTRPVNTKIVKEVLADRGYAPTTAPPTARSADRSGAWLQAGMAAAAVIALVAGGLAIVQPEFLRGERKAEPAPPPGPVAQRTEPQAQPQPAPRKPDVAVAPRAPETTEPPPPQPPRTAEPVLPMPPAPREPAPSVAAVEPPAPPPAPPRPTTTPAPAERQQVRPVPPALTPTPPSPTVAAPAPAPPKPAEVARAPSPPREATPPAPSAPPPAANPPPPQVARATPAPPPPAPAPAPDTRAARSGAADTAAANAAAQAAAQRRAQGPVPLAAPPARPAPPAPAQRPTPSIAAAPPPSAPAAPAAPPGPPSIMMPSASGSGIAAAPPSVEVADASAARAVPAPPPPTAQTVKAVRVGDSLWTMAEGVYGFVNPSILRRVQDANPHIRNINILAPGQEVVFPRVQESPFDRGTAVSEGLAAPGRN